MSRAVRLVALCVGRAGDQQQRWDRASVQRLLRPSPAQVPGPHRLTLGDFWADCTDGEIDLGPSRVLDWVELPAAHQVWNATSRQALAGASDRQLTAAVQQLVEACLPELPAADLATLAAADAVVVLTTLDSPVYWSQPITLPGGRRVLAAYLSTRCSHTSMAHELGHLLTARHSFGLPTAGVGTEYGNPYCIMSARRFGGRSGQVMYRIDDPPLLPDAALWQQVGPRLARATWWADHDLGRTPAATGRAIHTLVLEEVPIPIRLAHTAAGAGPDPRLLVIPIEPGRRWLTAEVRGPVPSATTVAQADWDGALALDRLARPGRTADRDTADAAGVVLHEVVDGRAVYRDTIALPPSGDTDALLFTAGRQVAVQVIGWANGVATLLVGDQPAHPMAWAEIRRTDGADGHCRFEVQLHSVGFDRPVFSWQVAGQTVVSRNRLGDRAVTRMTALPGAAPSDLGIVVAEVCWDQLTLDVALWQGSPGPITVCVDVTESAGFGSAAASRRAVDELLGVTARVTTSVCAGPDDQPGLELICTAT